MSKNIKDQVAHILMLQDIIKKKYLSEDKIIIERFNFCISCLNWTSEFFNKENKTDKQKIIYPLFANSFSSILVSINVGLWGTTIDSLHILRPVLEILSVADYIIDKDKFEDFKKVKVSLNKSKLDFDYLRKKKMIDVNLEKVYNKICNTSSHATLRRIFNNNFEIDGKVYTKYGCAYDPKNVGLLFGDISQISLYLTRVILTTLNESDPLCLKQKDLENLYIRLPES